MRLWKKMDVFQTCLKQSKGRPRYTFYDGPPFATGLPHYGHILAGTIKDVVTRFAHQSGFHVERRFGWDCHGLPVEYEIDKTLGIKGPEDVAKMGIAKYNEECRKIVMRYAKDWEAIVWRLGRWIDFDNDYKTMYPWFMESVWWTFKQLYEKGLVYKGFKVMPFSTACNTPLSNFESGQNYKEVVDPAVIVSFPLDDDPQVSMIAWTTTPWTLPSNLALCVNPEMAYVKVLDNATRKTYVMMEARLEALFKNPKEYTVIDTFRGEVLRGKRYKPIFPYFEHMKANGAFVVLCDGYVTEESGTGVVHQAPFFGEDDYRICLAASVISRDGEIVCPVDESGRFTMPVNDFEGEYVKDADKNIMKMLKANGRLVNQGSTKHSYPFCWRSETPLIYKAVPSWFVRVEQLVDKLLANNQKTYWVPDFVKEKRFGNWLRDARDWAISRNRYWGTPIPLWVSDDGQEIICVGSIKELNELTGEDVTDLHREHVDKLTIPSKLGKGVLRRITEVFDCWFESGSMPYAQAHYPFENKNDFDDAFPADFIAEGIDQTRGWFYTLLVLSTALFGKPPFKNLICNGLVLASDGQKMSKRKKNYPDPLEIVHNYGADALRLYLMNSPAVRGDFLRFKEEGVRDILKDVFLPWYNAYRFLIQNVDRYEREEDTFRYDETGVNISPNIMDHWIMSATQSLLLFVKKEMSAYRLYTVGSRLVKFVDHLTNWYVRFNRKRLKGEGGKDDCRHALTTLYSVLLNLTKIMSPFTPYLTEHMFQNLRHLLAHNHNSSNSSSVNTEMTSVHYLMLPETKTEIIDEVIERSVSRMQSVIELGRIIRDRKTIPVKYPLAEVIVIHKDEKMLQELRSLEKYILEELNVKCLTTTTDKSKYGVEMRADADHKTLGVRLRGDFKAVKQAITELTDKDIEEFLVSGKMMLKGHELGYDDVRISYTFKSSKMFEKYEAHPEEDLLVLLDIVPDQTLLEEGLAREVINRIQKLRKKAHLVPSDVVTIHYSVRPPDDVVAQVVTNYTTYIENTIKSVLLPLPFPPENTEVIIREEQLLKGAELRLVITRSMMDAASSISGALRTVGAVCGGDAVSLPFSKFINLELCCSDPTTMNTNQRATVLLENPQHCHPLDFNGLVKEVRLIYGMRDQTVLLFPMEDPTLPLDGANLSLEDLHRSTLLVSSKMELPSRPQNTPVKRKGIDDNETEPNCRYVNVELKPGPGGNHRASTRATVLLENPAGNLLLDLSKFRRQVELIFGLENKKFHLSTSSEKLNEIDNGKLPMLHSKTVYVFCE